MKKNKKTEVKQIPKTLTEQLLETAGKTAKCPCPKCVLERILEKSGYTEEAARQLIDNAVSDQPTNQMAQKPPSRRIIIANLIDDKDSETRSLDFKIKAAVDDHTRLVTERNRVQKDKELLCLEFDSLKAENIS